jgi:polyribonucleotide 5'-hydroxyl-kinase
MIAGPPDSGKSTTCKILSSYAVRLDRTPVYVDLDVGKGSLCVPGAISACCLDQSFLNVKVSISLLFIFYVLNHE